MKRNILLFSTLIFSILTAPSVNAQWLDASAKNEPYVASDFGFFQSRTGISLNTTSTNATDVRRTTDGGQTWTPVDMSKFKNSFFALSAVTNTTGFAGGQQLIKTTDAGSTWDSVSKISFVGVGRSQVSFQILSFASATVGFATLAASGNIIYKTTDGGKSWTPANTASGTINNLYVFDAADVYGIVDHNSVTYTGNGGGGTTWKTIPSSTFGNISIFNVLFLDANNGYVTGASGNLFHTTDGGSTWKNITLDTAVNLLGIQFLDPKNAIISGASEVIFSTSDSGKTWKHYYKPDPNSLFLYDLTKAYYFDKNNGAAMGNTGVESALLYNTSLRSDIPLANKSSLNLNIYPNPSTGLINVNTQGIDGNGLLTIINNAGKIVFRGNIEGNSTHTLSLSNYAKGLYTIEVATKNTIGHQQVIIE